MAHNIAKNAVERTSKALLGKVFPSLGKVAGEAAAAVFSAVVRAGRALVTDIAASLDGDGTSRKGRQEKVSGWLARYDFASPVRDHLWSEGAKLVGRDTVIAVDSGDISKEFGGAGMEGMEMGFDASRGVVAMGHSLLCAAVVARRSCRATFSARGGASTRTWQTPRASARRCDPRQAARSPTPTSRTSCRTAAKRPDGCSRP